MRGHDVISAWPMTAAGDRDSEASRLKILMDGGEFQGRCIAGFKVSINLFFAYAEHRQNSEHNGFTINIQLVGPCRKHLNTYLKILCISFFTKTQFP